MFKVREPLGNRARIGTQGCLFSMAMMLTACYLPSVTFSIKAKTHTVRSSNKVLGTWAGNQSSTLSGRAAVTGVKLGECLCLWAG